MLRTNRYTDTAAMSRRLTVYNRVASHPGMTEPEATLRACEKRKTRLAYIVMGCFVVLLWACLELYWASF